MGWSCDVRKPGGLWGAKVLYVEGKVLEPKDVQLWGWHFLDDVLIPVIRGGDGQRHAGVSPGAVLGPSWPIYPQPSVTTTPPEC